MGPSLHVQKKTLQLITKESFIYMCALLCANSSASLDAPVTHPNFLRL